MGWMTDRCESASSTYLDLTDKLPRLDNDLFGKSLGFTF